MSYYDSYGEGSDGGYTEGASDDYYDAEDSFGGEGSISDSGSDDASSYVAQTGFAEYRVPGGNDSDEDRYDGYEADRSVWGDTTTDRTSYYDNSVASRDSSPSPHQSHPISDYEFLQPWGGRHGFMHAYGIPPDPEGYQEARELIDLMRDAGGYGVSPYRASAGSYPETQHSPHAAYYAGTSRDPLWTTDGYSDGYRGYGGRGYSAPQSWTTEYSASAYGSRARRASSYGGGYQSYQVDRASDYASSYGEQAQRSQYSPSDTGSSYTNAESSYPSHRPVQSRYENDSYGSASQGSYGNGYGSSTRYVYGDGYSGEFRGDGYGRRY